MKLYLINFALWLYLNLIQEDWNEYTLFGKICIYPMWMIRTIVIILSFPIWILVYEFSKGVYFNSLTSAHERFTAEQITKLNELQRTRKAKGKRTKK